MFSDEAGVDLVHEVPIFRNKSVLSVNILDKFQNSIKYTRRIFFDFGVTSKKNWKLTPSLSREFHESLLV